MSDLGHMDRRYLWRAGKTSRRVHILYFTTGRTHCQTENGGGKPLDGRGAEIPDERRVCRNCADLAGRNEGDYREPDIRVLLGERMADVEPMLFAGTVTPEPWEQKKQTRRVNRSKERQPKRSNVKYAKPFDDPLPW